MTATIDKLRDCVSSLVALTIEESSPVDAASVVALLRDQIVCVGTPQPHLSDRIDARLKATFPNSMFKIEIE